MRSLLTLSAAASVLALGVSVHHAMAFSPGAKVAASDLVLKVQKSDDKGSGAGAGKSDTSGTGGTRGPSPGAAQDKEKSTARSKEGGTRASQKGARTDVDVNVRGKRADRNRSGARVDIDVNDRRRRAGRTDTNVNVRGYGYSAGGGCQELLRRYNQCIARK
jgi:hypothetical protein